MAEEKQTLIVKVDGVDGCGKTTLVEGLAHVYADRLTVIATREFGSLQDHKVIENRPQGTVSRLLYEMSLNPRLEFDDTDLQLAMALASRRQNHLILPKLRGTCDLIVSDRSSLTSYAYGHQLGTEFREFLGWAVEPILEEDAVLWIDIDPRIAFKRRRTNSDFVLEKVPTHIVERKGLAFQLAVANQFEALAKERKNIFRLDGSLDCRELLSVTVACVDQLLAGRQP